MFLVWQENWFALIWCDLKIWNKSISVGWDSVVSSQPTFIKSCNKNYYWLVNSEMMIRVPQCSTRVVGIKINMKGNWEPSVDEVYLWDYRYVFVWYPFYVAKLIVGIWYRYDMITKMLSSQCMNMCTYSSSHVMVFECTYAVYVVKFRRFAIRVLGSPRAMK